MDHIEIIEYEEKYHQVFKSLAYEWLEKYNLLAPEDEVILNHPQGKILDEGGKIFFARYKGEIVGTASVIKVDEATFELAKLGVSESYQRLGIASMLVERCIMILKQRGIKEMILFTNQKLNAATQLYRKFGFVEMAIDNNKYIEADTKMKLDLS